MRFLFALPLLIVAAIFVALIWAGAAWWLIVVVGVVGFFLLLGLFPMIVAGRVVNVRDYDPQLIRPPTTVSTSAGSTSPAVSKTAATRPSVPAAGSVAGDSNGNAEPLHDVDERGIADHVARGLRAGPEFLPALADWEQLLAEVGIVGAEAGIVPAEPGFYAFWTRREVLARVPVVPNPVTDALRLLYVGISPARPSSRGTIRSRVKQHFTGNVGSSTLRLTLASFLIDELELEPFMGQDRGQAST